MSEDKLSAAIYSGAKAERLLADETLNDIFDHLEKRYIEAWRVTDALDTAAREKLHVAVNVVRKVKDHLHSMASDGKLAKRELDEMIAKPK